MEGRLIPWPASAICPPVDPRLSRLFLGPADAVMSAPIAVSGDAVEPGTPVKLFGARLNDLTVARDGRLLLARAITPVTPAMQLLLNWRAVVEQKP